MKTLQSIFEKLLPTRFWQRPPVLNDDQYWGALNATLNPQTLAVLHIAQDRFMAHVQTAADVEAPSEKRLRALDRAMALADFLSGVDSEMELAKTEVIRRAAMKEEADQKKQ